MLAPGNEFSVRLDTTDPIVEKAWRDLDYLLDVSTRAWQAAHYDPSIGLPKYIVILSRDEDEWTLRLHPLGSTLLGNLGLVAARRLMTELMWKHISESNRTFSDLLWSEDFSMAAFRREESIREVLERDMKIKRKEKTCGYNGPTLADLSSISTPSDASVDPMKAAQSSSPSTTPSA